MRIPHNAIVVVTDGSRMLFFRNEGDAEFPNLQIERKREQDNPPDRAQSADEPGRAFSSHGTTRSAYEETDFHQLEEDRFAADTAELLKQRALRNDFDQLIVCAPARTLGELRKHYHGEVEKRLIGEVSKELTGHPVPEIEQILKAS